MRSVLVVLNCSKRKSIDLGLVYSRIGKVPDFDIESESIYRQVLSDLMRPAIDMYDGPEFRILRKFRWCIDLFVFSARYGIINGERPIIPYDAYLKDVDYSVIDKWAKYGNWDLNKLIGNTWDIAIIRLSHKYMEYFMKVVRNPCTLGRRIHIITGKHNNKLACKNEIPHYVRGPGQSQSALLHLLTENC
jgi:hypothetical protein